MEKAPSYFGREDVVINNAGMSVSDVVEELGEPKSRELINSIIGTLSSKTLREVGLNEMTKAIYSAIYYIMGRRIHNIA